MRMKSLLFLLAAIVVAILIGMGFDLSRVNWRVIDILAIACGGSVFFTVAGEAARFLTGNLLPYKKGYASTALRVVENWAEGLPKMIGLKFQQSKISPPEFDEIQRQHDLVRPWAQEHSTRIATICSQELPELTLKSIAPFPEGITNPDILHVRDIAYETIQKYERLRADVLEIERQLKPTATDEILVVAGPFLVAAAIGLTLFKAIYGPE